MSYDLTNPDLELTDPCPDIHTLFIDFNDRFFEGTLARCEVKWSSRMFSCAGVCSYECRSGMCSIRLSLPLLKLRPRKDLVETLLHEMIHAFLFVTQRNRDRNGHGSDFLYHMHRINQMANTRITVYHSFHDEVTVYKQHIWRCNGPCRQRRPFYGFVKRSCNRAPGPNDYWWNAHKSTCSGTFHKIKEPEGYGQRKRKGPTETDIPGKKHKTDKTLDQYFSNAAIGRGQVCGVSDKLVNQLNSSTAASSSRASVSTKELAGCLQRIGGPFTKESSGISDRTAVKHDLEFVREDLCSPSTPALSTSSASERKNDMAVTVFPNYSVSVEKTTTLDTFVCCPLCDEKVIEFFVNDHLDICLSLQ
ncbi:hypothetical protein DICVIV_01603 [Dictyocaulus viviparus]|uniref:SprT-like domain-containing protein n=1 Tax=Dictyocaulus viviparus TaxID=29172 RepID=A0A0D8Y5I9_DICVI|nr:hypothetical protein DICVIV_01603 [Dictyocaulus viviparus]